MKILTKDKESLSILDLCLSLHDLGEQDRLYREAMREQWAEEDRKMDAFFARSRNEVQEGGCAMIFTIPQMRAARALLDWTQKDLADHAGMSQTSIARIENGTNKPLLTTQEKIFSAFKENGIVFIDTLGVIKKECAL